MALEIEGIKYVADLSAWSGNVKKVIDDTGNAEKSIGSMAKSFNDGLKVVENSIGAVVAAYVTFDRVISEGESIVQGRALFTAMAGGAQAAARGEEELSQATRGLVDDDVALAGASKLLSLHLADNVDQASVIVGLGTQLGKVFLGDAAGGMNAFNTALANTSARPLQALGISYDEVAKRQKELERQGLATRDAFRQAMIEVATAVRDNLGDSVIMAGTALQRQKIVVEDYFDAWKEGAAKGYENLTNLVNLLSEHPNLMTSAANQVLGTNFQEGVSQADAWTEVIYNTLQSKFSDLDPAFLRDFIRRGIEQVKNDPDLQNMAQDISNAAQLPMDSVLHGDVQTIGELNDILVGVQSMVGGLQEGAQAQDQINKGQAAYNQLLGVAKSGTQVWANAMSDFRAQYDEFTRQQTTSTYMNMLTDNYQQLSTYMHDVQSQGGRFNGIALFSPEEAQGVQVMAAQFNSALDSVTALHNQGIISDADYDKAKGMATSMNQMATDAQKGAEALQGMNLAQLLGQVSGGPAGEIVSQVEQFLQNENVNTDQLSQIKDAMELVTGQQTTASEALKNDIVPALASIAQSNATAAGQSAVAIQEYAKAQALAGQAVTEAGMLNAGGLGVNPNAGSRQITVTAGQTATEAARANNITIAQLLATTGALNVNSVPVGTFTMNGGTAVLPLQGPGTTFGGGGTPDLLTNANGQSLIGGNGQTGPGAPLVNGQQEIVDAGNNVQTVVAQTGDVVRQRSIDMGIDMTTLNTTGQTELTGPTGLTVWWDQLEAKIHDVYNRISPLITSLGSGIKTMNDNAQSLSTGGGSPTGMPSPTTGHGYASGGRISDTSIVGERGPELYTPSRAGYIINAAHTDSILSALAGALSGGGSHVNNNQRSATVNQYITVQGNAQAVSTMQNVNDALRGF